MTRSLIKLALEGTDDSRRRLFGQVSELVISDLDKRTDRELAIFAEVIIKLYGHGCARERARLARTLAVQPNTPVDLARILATDDVQIAVPMLASCQVFSQDDLLDFVERLSTAHLQVIARRPDLSTRVSDVIAVKGDLPVHRILAGNREIRLSRETMLTLVKHAAEDVAVREDLAMRSDLTPAVCQALLPLVDEDAKKRLHQLIEGAMSQDQLERISRLRALRRSFGPHLEERDAGLLWQEACRAGITVNELLILLLQDKRFDTTMELLAARGRTAQTSLKDAVFNDKPDLVIRTAAKAGLEVATFALFSKVRCEQLGEPVAAGSAWTAAYRRHIDGSHLKKPRNGDFQANRGSRKPRASAERPLRPVAM